jgi:ABC-2 type transport system ATP-binding protein
VLKGKIIAMDTLAGLLESHASETYAVSGDRLYPILQALRSYVGTRYCFAFGREHHLVLQPDSGGPDAALAYLRGLGHQAATIRQIRPNVEDVFIRLIQERAHD